jgi:hypothetical protein
VQCRRREGLVLQGVPDCQSLAQVVLGVGCIGRGHLDGDEAQRGPHARNQSSAPGGIGEEIHVVEARHAAAQHFSAGEQSPVVDELCRSQAGFHRPDVILQPVHEGAIVGYPAHQRHGGMRMQIDEARDQGVVVELDAPRSREACLRFARRQHRGYGSPVNDNGMTAKHRVRRGDRHDPTGLDDGRCLWQRASGNKKALPKQGF